MEKQLLCHPSIPTLKLTKKSLEDLYACLEKGSFSGLDLFPFESKIYRNVLDVKTEQQKISSELAIMTKALIKLENLYHYPCLAHHRTLLPRSFLN